MIEIVEDEKELARLLSTYRCEKDKDIEFFLHHKAIIFEKLSKSRTYLIFDLEQITNISFGEPIFIYGYITLALKVFSLPESISNRIRKELDGFSSKIHGRRIEEFPCYLIGQLSKASNLPESSLTGKDLLVYAHSLIYSASCSVGGRYFLIECKNNPKLLEFYLNNGFVEISRIPFKNESMVQMIYKI